MSAPMVIHTGGAVPSGLKSAGQGAGMVAVAELVGGPIDGSQFTVPEPPPYEWRRAAPELPVLSFEPTGEITAAPSLPYERYVRDDKPRNDGIWCYRWQGRARG